ALFGGFARMMNGEGFSEGIDPAVYAKVVEATVSGWGTGGPLIWLFGLSSEGDPDLPRRAARCERLSATPTMLRRLWGMNSSIGVRDALAQIGAPTLVVHREGDGIVPISAGRFLADRIAGARFLEIEGMSHFPFVGDFDRTVDAIGSLFGAPPTAPASTPA